jgi:hypothetical protein
MEAFCGAHGPENLLKVTENLSDCRLLLVFQAFDRSQSKSCKLWMMSVEQMFDIREMLAVKFLVSVECDELKGRRALGSAPCLPRAVTNVNERKPP